MSDVLEVQIIEEPQELVFDNQPLEVLIQEDNFEVLIDPDIQNEVLISDEHVEILTIAEQGPAGVGGDFPLIISTTPPTSPNTGDLWLDIN